MQNANPSLYTYIGKSLVWVDNAAISGCPRNYYWYCYRPLNAVTGAMKRVGSSAWGLAIKPGQVSLLPPDSNIGRYNSLAEVKHSRVRPLFGQFLH